MSIAPVRAGSPNTAQQTDRTAAQKQEVPLYKQYLNAMSAAYAQMVASFNASRKAYSAGKPATSVPKKKATPKKPTQAKPRTAPTKASDDNQPRKTEKKEALDDTKKAAAKEDVRAAEKTAANDVPDETKPQKVGTTEGSKPDVKTDEDNGAQPLAEEPITVC